MDTYRFLPSLTQRIIAAWGGRQGERDDPWWGPSRVGEDLEVR